jgi:hypothetical protein
LSVFAVFAVDQPDDSYDSGMSFNFQIVRPMIALTVRRSGASPLVLSSHGPALPQRVTPMRCGDALT